MVLTLVLWALIGLLLQVCGREGERWVHSQSFRPSSSPPPFSLLHSCAPNFWRGRGTECGPGSAHWLS